MGRQAEIVLRAQPAQACQPDVIPYGPVDSVADDACSGAKKTTRAPRFTAGETLAQDRGATGSAAAVTGAARPVMDA